MSFKTIEELGLSDEFIAQNTDDSDVKAVRSFFQRFEKDSDPGDLSTAEESYFSSFLFCNPDTANLIKKEDFLRFLPLMTAKYRKSGFKEKEVNAIKVISLDRNYLLANVSWKMIFRKDDKEQKYHDIKATYILKNDDDGYKIILQLDHQNLSDIILE